VLGFFPRIGVPFWRYGQQKEPKRGRKAVNRRREKKSRETPTTGDLIRATDRPRAGWGLKKVIQ